MGDEFTVADAYLFTITRWTVPMKIDIASHANVAAYMARVGQRPAVQRALKEEGLV